MARPSIIHTDPAGGLQPGAQHVTRFDDERVLAVDQQAHHLPLRDGDADRLQLRHQPRNGDLSLVI